MPGLSVRGIDEEVYEKLRSRAKATEYLWKKRHAGFSAPR
jgi:hypothetical protein